jgi:hypothetical protein
MRKFKLQFQTTVDGYLGWLEAISSIVSSR